MKNASQLLDLFLFRLLLSREWRLNSVACDPEYSLSEIFILELIQRFDGIVATNLSRFLGKSQSTISGIITGLEKAGLVERRHGFGLEKTLCLTPAGTVALERNRAHGTAFLSAALMDGMSEEELASIDRCLSLLVQKQEKFLELIYRG